MNGNSEPEFTGEECTPRRVSEWLAGENPPQILDVREGYELEEGIIPGAVHIPLHSVPGEVARRLNPDRPLVVYCAHGVRSLHAIRFLRSQGWEKSLSMSGGFVEWLQENYQVESHGSASEVAAGERYRSQLRLPEIGLEGQRKLLSSKVLIIGAGGLGCPAATYLAAAGVGDLTLVDDDRVDLSNLPRQVLFHTRDVGEQKAPLAANALREMNPEIQVTEVSRRLNNENVNELITGMDVIVDACDNFETRFIVNDAAAKKGIPVIHGAVHKFEGIVTVFHPAQGGPCLRCLHPSPPSAEDCGSCAEVGVLGVLPGLVGIYQSLEALKLIAGFGKPLIGRVLALDTLSGDHRKIQLPINKGCACNRC